MTCLKVRKAQSPQLHQLISRQHQLAQHLLNLRSRETHWLEVQYYWVEGYSRNICGYFKRKHCGIVAAINAQTSSTGVAAAVDANGALKLTENFNGEIKMSHVEINGVNFAEEEVEYFANFTSYDGTGEIIGEVRKLTDMDQIVGTSVNNLNATLNHISSQMAFVGAQINKVDTQSQVLSERKITVDEKISEIGDADLTELITQLKSLILNRMLLSKLL